MPAPAVEQDGAVTFQFKETGKIDDFIGFEQYLSSGDRHPQYIITVDIGCSIVLLIRKAC